MFKKCLHLLLLFPVILNAQNKTTKFYNNIGTVGKIETTNSEIKIKKANTVIVKILISNASVLYLKGYGQYKDTLGNYITNLLIIGDGSEVRPEINLIFDFDKPIIGSNVNLAENSPGVMALYPACSSDMKKCQYRGNFGSEKGIVFSFTSKEKINISIVTQ